MLLFRIGGCAGHPNPDAPQRTGKTSFKSSIDVSYYWGPARATDAQSKWLDLAIHHKVTLADILQMYGIRLNEQPWPVGSAELPTLIPLRSTPHDARAAQGSLLEEEV